MSVTETRMGLGVDVHQMLAHDSYLDANAKVMRLCGVDVPSEHYLKGHSDADVGLHAITDALLGAAGEGDIGQHFPPSEKQWRDVDSAVFVEKAVELITKKQGRIVNVDVTLICEQPKIGSYRSAMQRKVADILGVAHSRVNIKATTTETLGFTGRGEGVAAQAVASVEMPRSETP